MLLSKSMEKSFHRLTKPSARHAFIEAEAVTAIAHQIRIVRQQRGWTQRELAKRLNTTQAAVSRLEDPNYGRLNVKTLVELAKVFDVALQVRFISLVTQFRKTWTVKREQLEVEAFEEESMRVGFILSKPYSSTTTIELTPVEGQFISLVPQYSGTFNIILKNIIPVPALVLGDA